MLSLKESHFQDRLRRKKISIEGLPNEILDIVMRKLYNDSGRQLSSIIPYSLSCRHLRRSSNTIMFHDLTILISERGLHRRSRAFLEHLLDCPHLLRHVRQLRLYNPVLVEIENCSLSSSSSGSAPDFSSPVTGLLKDCLRAMTGLSRIM
jgi:hypothetical protein